MVTYFPLHFFSFLSFLEKICSSQNPIERELYILTLSYPLISSLTFGSYYPASTSILSFGKEVFNNKYLQWICDQTACIQKSVSVHSLLIWGTSFLFFLDSFHLFFVVIVRNGTSINGQGVRIPRYLADKWFFSQRFNRTILGNGHSFEQKWLNGFTKIFIRRITSKILSPNDRWQGVSKVMPFPANWHQRSQWIISCWFPRSWIIF